MNRYRVLNCPGADVARRWVTFDYKTAVDELTGLRVTLSPPHARQTRAQAAMEVVDALNRIYAQGMS